MGRTDVAVVGGGPAGAAAAILLARAGRSVCVLERKAEAHHKVCGEFISGGAARHLERLGIDLPGLGAEPVRHLRLINGESVLTSQLPFQAWSLSRRRLDQVLLQRAEQAGACVKQASPVRALCADHDGCQLLSGTTSLRAHRVFLASGKWDLRGWSRRDRNSHYQIALKMHLRLNKAQQDGLFERVELFLLDHGYAGLERIEDGKANLCFLLSKQAYFACRKDWDLLLNYLRSQSPHLDERLAGADCLWQRPLAVAGTPYGYLRPPAPHTANIYCLGDQMAVIPSLVGDGIAMALHSAALAAGSYLKGADSIQYHQQATKDFRPALRSALALAKLLQNEPGRRFAFSLARLWPGLLPWVTTRVRLRCEM